MMTKANKIFLIIGILLVIFGFFIEFTIGITSVIGFMGGIMIPIGGALIFLSLVLQKKYKGSKL